MDTHFAEQSSLSLTPTTGALHVALLPDGNGRWAQARGLPRAAGHREGVEVVRRMVRAAPDEGIGTLTVHALSCDNWKRPAAEVRSILDCVRTFLDAERDACVREGVRVTVLGRRDRLPACVLASIEASERATECAERLHLRLGVDYSSRLAIRDAAHRLDRMRRVDALSRELGRDGPHDRPVPDVDLLVRTGGETRLSDFLLWECAYAELLFVETPWPDFGPDDLARAVAEFRRRERRFGGLPEPAAAAVGDAR